ncbi:MAG: hypothetical protein E3K36_05175 [Candidatus Brocadia sp.]|nr:hypothetical protein [Candidatus Brocadia sp.]
MISNTFFACSKCGNKKKFRVFTSSFRSIEQSPEMGIRIESGALPNLRENDNYIECQLCSQRFDCDTAQAIGKTFIKK